MQSLKPVTNELLTAVVEALFPATSDDSAASVGPCRNAAGQLNPAAWSRVLSLLLWFGYDSLAVHSEVLAQALEQDIEFPTETLSVQSVSLEFFRMLVAIRVGMPPGEAIEMIEAIRADVWRVADAINGDNGYQPDKHYYQTATRLSLRLDELDEQINERIQEKTSEIRSHL